MREDTLASAGNGTFQDTSKNDPSAGIARMRVVEKEDTSDSVRPLPLCALCGRRVRPPRRRWVWVLRQQDGRLDPVHWPCALGLISDRLGLFQIPPTEAEGTSS
jgi:hypothetical protein